MFFSFVLLLTLSPTLYAQTDISTQKDNSKKIIETPLGLDKSKKLMTLNDHFGSMHEASSEKPFDANSIQSLFSTWIVFQKTCKTCHTMMREQKCFKSKKNNVFFVGILAKPKNLFEAAQKQNPQTKVLYTKTDLVLYLKLDVTPTVFIFKGDQLIHRNDNYMTCKAIKAQIAKYK